MDEIYIAVQTGQFALPGAPGSYQVYARCWDGAYRAVDWLENHPAWRLDALEKAESWNREGRPTQWREPHEGMTPREITARREREGSFAHRLESQAREMGSIAQQLERQARAMESRILADGYVPDGLGGYVKKSG